MARADGKGDDDGDTAWIDVALAGSEREGTAFEIAVRIAAGASALDAIRASGALERFPGLDISTASVGIWGRVVPLTTALEPGDRVEIYRPLAIDPKEARRKRALQLRNEARRKGNRSAA